MKILILGGTAFTGPYVVQALAAQGHHVRVLHRGQHLLDPLPAHVKKVNAELSSLQFYRDFLRQQAYDVVVHMIAMTRRDAQDAVDVFAGHAGRAVVISSHDVYAQFGGLAGVESPPLAATPLDETAPLRTSRYLKGPDNPHEKIDVEEAFLGNAGKLPVTILRMAVLFGPGDPRHRFFAYLKRFDDRRPAILLDPDFGMFRQSHAFVENAAHAIALAVTSPHPPNRAARIYNVSENSQTRISSMAERLHDLARAAAYKGRIILVPKDRCPPHLRKAGNFQYDQVISDGAIRRELGYAEMVTAEEGYRRTVAWHRGLASREFDAGDFDYAAEDGVMRDLGGG
jgi:nucleoside-diphosphate-sugar epimerase